MIAVLIPSRGVLSSRMAESLDRELCRGDLRLYSHALPIPEAFNDLVERFLRSEAEAAWFVEEDVEPPRGSLDWLLSCEADVVAMDYILKTTPPIVSHRFKTNSRSVLDWVGLGCTLIRRRVFEVVPGPWFRTDLCPVTVHAGSGDSWHEELRVRDPKIYAGQDSYFCYVVRQAGMKIATAGEWRAEHWSFDLEKGFDRPVMTRIFERNRPAIVS